MDNNTRVEILSTTRCLVHEIRPLTFDAARFEQRSDDVVEFLRNNVRRVEAVLALTRRFMTA